MNTRETGRAETLLSGVLSAFGWQRCVAGLRDRLFWLAVLAGGIGLLYAPTASPAFWRLVLSGFSEELTFRALVQEQLDATLRFSGSPLLRRIGIVPANLLVSLGFALAHLPTQSIPAALSTFFPSLIFGLIWTRTRSLWLCAALHIYYNVLYHL